MLRLEMITSQHDHSSFRYEQLADYVGGLIANGTLTSGERIPSVRATSEKHGISVSTVLQAYKLLEDRGTLVSYPKSGYFVAGKRGGTLGLPTMARQRAKASTVSLGGAVAVLLEHASNSALVPLGCAVPDAALLQSAKLDFALSRAARQQGMSHNVYGDVRGDIRLRREISKRSSRLGHMVFPEDILITSGCTEAVTLALMTVAKRGDTVAVESPTYFGLLHTLEVLGLKALELPTDPTRGVSIPALEKILVDQPVAACVLSSGFNNPLGSAMSDDDKRTILALLFRHRVPLVEDDVYGDIYYGSNRPQPFIAFDSKADIIYCSSFSKCLAPGYRIGWIASKAFSPQIVERKLALSLCNPTLLQVAFADFLATCSYDAHLRRLRQILEGNVAMMTSTIEVAFPSCTKVSRPTGGFSLWLELPKPFDSRALFDEALEQGICFAPGDVFSASRRFRNCLRLSAGGVWNQRIEDGVRRLGQIAQRMIDSE